MPPKVAKKGAEGKDKKGSAKKKKAESDPAAAAAAAALQQAAAERAGKMQELRKQLRAMEAEKAAEQSLTSEYQREKDVIQQFWEQEKQRREELKVALRDRLRDKQDMEERHAEELNMFKAKVKHLLHEHQAEMTEAHMTAEGWAQQQKDVHRSLEHELEVNVRAAKVAAKELEESHQRLLSNVREAQAVRFRELREEFELRSHELTAAFREREKNARASVDQTKNREIRKIVLEKDHRIQKLVLEHKKSFDGIKSYYRDITFSNLDLIKTLKEELARLKSGDAQRQKHLVETRRQHQKLVQPLQDSLHLLEQLKHDLQVHDRNVAELDVTSERLAVVEDALKQQSWDVEVLTQRHQQAVTERDELRLSLANTTLDMEQKSGFRRLVTERKIAAASEELEKTEATLGEVLVSTSLRPDVVGDIKRNLQDVLEEKGGVLRKLEEHINDLRTQYYDLIHVFESKMLEHSVPLEELGFVPEDV